VRLGRVVDGDGIYFWAQGQRRFVDWEDLSYIDHFISSMDQL
jgi:hypothetical protein